MSGQGSPSGFLREIDWFWPRSLKSGDWTGLEINLAGGWAERSVVQWALIYPGLVRDGRLEYVYEQFIDEFKSDYEAIHNHKRDGENECRCYKIKNWEGIISVV